MAGTIVNIYPGASNSGLTHTTLSPAVYAALSGTELNTIRVRGGYRYPYVVTDMKGQAKWGIDVPIQWQVDASYGSDQAIIDCGTRYLPDSLAGTWDSSVGLWYIDVYTGGVALPASVLFVGATAGNTLASMQWGEGYRPAQYNPGAGETIATAKARCGNYTSLASILDGYSIWTSEVISGTTCRIWIWTPSSLLKPASYWGGFVVEAPQSTGTSLGSTPRYSPFVVGVASDSGAKSPNGTLVEAGFSVAYAYTNAVGHHSDREAWGPVTDVRYRSLRCYGGIYAFRVGHENFRGGGHRLTAFRVEDGIYHDDLNLPDKNPMAGFPTLTDGTSRGETISVGGFADDVYVRGVKAIVGTTHGIVNVGWDAAAVGERAMRPYVIDVEGEVRAGSRDARGFSVNNCVDGEFYNYKVKGAGVRGHVGGENTKCSNFSFTGDTESLNDPKTAHGVLDVRSDLDSGAVSVTLRQIYIDRRLSPAAEPWSCIEIRGSTAIAAGAIKIYDSVLHPKAGYAAIWMWDTTGTNVNRDQKIINVWTSGAIDTKESNTQTSQGTTKTFAGMFNGAGAEVRDNQTNVAGDILSNPACPVRRIEVRQSHGVIPATRYYNW